MKLFEVSIPIYLNKVVNQIILLLKLYFEQKKHDYKALLNLYSEEEIYNAISSIFISGKSVYAPISGKNGIILRYLEYGGKDVKANKLLSKVSRAISRKVNGDDYVF